MKHKTNTLKVVAVLLFIAVFGLIIPAALFFFLYFVFPSYFVSLYILALIAALYLGYVIGGVVALIFETHFFDSLLHGVFEGANVAGESVSKILKK